MLHLGRIELGDIQNDWKVSSETKVLNLINELTSDQIKYVYYPDCQQLLIWLPNTGSNYKDLKIFKLDQNLEIYSENVETILNGSIQIILESTLFEPASYRLEIDWPRVIKHKLFFQKLKPGQAVREETSIPEIPGIKNESISNRRRYYDSNGQLVPDDIDFREAKLNELLMKWNRKIEYEEAGRGGTIIYIEGETRLKFYYEFGGNNCIVFIMIPTEQSWETETGIALTERKDIIEFIASTVHREKVPSSRIEINSSSISFYTK